MERWVDRVPHDRGEFGDRDRNPAVDVVSLAGLTPGQRHQDCFCHIFDEDETAHRGAVSPDHEIVAVMEARSPVDQGMDHSRSLWVERCFRTVDIADSSYDPIQSSIPRRHHLIGDLGP
jgi:hypothetical protein